MLYDTLDVKMGDRFCFNLQTKENLPHDSSNQSFRYIVIINRGSVYHNSITIGSGSNCCFYAGVGVELSTLFTRKVHNETAFYALSS